MADASALTRLDGFSDSDVPVLAYAVYGEVTDADIERLASDIERLDRLRLLLRIDRLALPDASAFSRQLVRMKMDALRKVERYALVGGPSWVAAYASVVDAVVPFSILHFDYEEEAREWITQDSTLSEVDHRQKAEARAAPAMARLDSDRPDLVAVAVDGYVTSADYTAVLDPAIDEALAAHDALDILIRVDRLDGVSLGAVLEDAALAKHLRHFRRFALVNGPEWMRAAVQGLGTLTAMEAQTFTSEAEARAWLDS